MIHSVASGKAHPYSFKPRLVHAPQCRSKLSQVWGQGKWEVVGWRKGNSLCRNSQIQMRFLESYAQLDQPSYMGEKLCILEWAAMTSVECRHNCIQWIQWFSEMGACWRILGALCKRWKWCWPMVQNTLGGGQLVSFHFDWGHLHFSVHRLLILLPPCFVHKNRYVPPTMLLFKLLNDGIRPSPSHNQ